MTERHRRNTQHIVIDLGPDTLKVLTQAITKLVSRQLADIHRDIKELRKAMDANTTRIIGALNDATNAIATKIQALIDRGDLSPEATTELEGVVTRLQSLAADPANPVPSE